MEKINEIENKNILAESEVVEVPSTTLIEGNNLIAHFMGVDKAFDARSKIYHYDSSWDWLMPAVRKIQGIAGPLIDSDSEDKRYAFLLFTLSIVTPIETVYMYVINYINWYNQSIGTKSNRSM